MDIETIITLKTNEKYYLADVTVQNGVKYFLANKLDANEELTEESCILEEVPYEDKFYFDEVKDEKVLNYIAAVFTANFITEIDES